MANNITLSTRFVDALDEVYQAASVTGGLVTADELAQEGANAGEIKIPKLTMDGLSDYSRNAGYTQGSVNLDWESVKFNYDRGKKFSVDSMDNQETINLAFGRLAAEFVRTKVAPEKDAFTFAKLAAKAGNKGSGALADGKKVTAAIREALDAMDAEEVSEGRYLFITSALLRMVNDLDTTVSRMVLGEFGDRIVTVPTKRFYSDTVLSDGSFTGTTALNFMIVEPTAVIKFDKHIASTIIVPENNPDADAYILKYREYGLVDVYENKTAGIYAHTAS